MQLKSLMLATTSLAMLATAGSAQAGEFDGLYISVFGGANFQHDQSGVQAVASSSTLTTFAHTFDAKTGFVIGGAIGTDLWVKGLRGEVEVSYRRNDVGGGWRIFSTTGSDSSSSVGSFDGNTSTFAVMANVWYDIQLGWKIVPYIGGGVGWARSKMDGAFLTSSLTSTLDQFSVEHSGFAYQLGAGFNYEVSPGVDLGIGYRYFNAPNLTIGVNNSFGPTDFVVKNDNDSHAVQLNLTIHTN